MLACIPYVSRKPLQVRSTTAASSAVGLLVLFPAEEGEVLTPPLAPCPTFRNARHCLKEPKLFSVSILTLCNKVHCLYIGYREKINVGTLVEGFLEVGLKVGLKD